MKELIWKLIFLIGLSVCLTIRSDASTVSKRAEIKLLLIPFVSIRAGEPARVQDLIRETGRGTALSSKLFRKILFTSEEVNRFIESGGLVGRSLVRHRLLMLKGDGGFALHGAHASLLKREVEYYPVEQIVGEAKTRLVETLESQGYLNVDVSHSGLSKIRVPLDAKLNWHVDELRRLNKRTVYVDYESKEAGTGKIALWFEVRGRVDVAVLNRHMDEREVLRRDAISVEARSIQELGGRNPFRDLNKIDEYLMLVPSRPGSVLFNGMLKSRPDVFAGSTVLVQTSQGRILVQGEAIAQEDGWIGETILVKSISSSTHYRAKILDGGLLVASVE